MIVVAPTGVAAINAGGVTIHSFFQLPFGPYIPGLSEAVGGEGKKSKINKFSREKINVIKSIDLLVIDEISMVRADLLDAVDDVLRRYRGPVPAFRGCTVIDDWRLATVGSCRERRRMGFTERTLPVDILFFEQGFG